jgi:adenosine deaminase
METSLQKFIEGLPKVELHLHIEGSFEPELMFEIAQRNGIALKYPNVEALRKAYQFNNLQEFLDIYYEGAGVLTYERDFYELTMAYLHKVHKEQVKHVELFFDPQTHTHRGISFDTVIDGILRALDEAKEVFGMSGFLILSFLRHLSEEDAFQTLAQAEAYRSRIIGVGLDSSELGNPPSKFERVFAEAKNQGYLLMAHAGEEGPAAYIWEALELLKVDRIDHGNRCLEDEALVKALVERKMALTLCPLSNKKLQVCPDLSKHPLRTLMQRGVLATIHSDDPAYFGGYMNANYAAVAEALQLDKQELAMLSVNAIDASFLDAATKQSLKLEVATYLKKNSQCLT